MENEEKTRSIEEELTLVKKGYLAMKVQDMPYLDRIVPGQHYYFESGTYPISKHFLSALVSICRERKLWLPSISNIGTSMVEFYIQTALDGVIDYEWFYHQYALHYFEHTDNQIVFIPSVLKNGVRAKLYRKGISLYKTQLNDHWKVADLVDENRPLSLKDRINGLIKISKIGGEEISMTFTEDEPSTVRVVASQLKKETNEMIFVSKVESGVRVFVLQHVHLQSDIDDIMNLRTGNSIVFRDTERPESYIRRLAKMITTSTNRILDVNVYDAEENVVSINCVGFVEDPSTMTDERLIEVVKENGMIQVPHSRMTEELNDLIVSQNDQSMCNIFTWDSFVGEFVLLCSF